MQIKWQKNLATSAQSNMNQQTVHKSVLLQEVIDSLNIINGGVYVDATLGGAGHAKVICQSGSDITLIGIDADAEAVSRAKKVLENVSSKVILKVSPNHFIDEVLSEVDIEKINGCLFDLGMSSDQLETSGRGFSFQKDEPLMMTMKSRLEEGDLTAREILNTWEEKSIADILWGYGEERFARRIAHSIVEARKEKPIETTYDLVEIIEDSVPGWYKRRKTHPATKTFQALRITVNNEIENLKVALEKSFKLLGKGGRLSVITFHSLEDRLVKRYFKRLKEEKLGNLITKKPIKPSEEEIKSNPRARSALLRVIEKNE